MGGDCFDFFFFRFVLVSEGVVFVRSLCFGGCSGVFLVCFWLVLFSYVGSVAMCFGCREL